MRYLTMTAALLLCACSKKPAPAQSTASATAEASSSASPFTAPNSAAWDSSRQVQLKALTANGCTANLLPPWLQVSCTSKPDNSGVVSFDKGTPHAVIIQDEGPGGEGPLKNTITFPLKPGETVRVSAGAFHIPTQQEVAAAEAQAKGTPAGSAYVPTAHAHMLVFNFKWAGGQALPTVAVE